ncbi:hypothetical protein LRH25_25675 [Ideonella azotifigens]|uniref:HAF repeat-containing protein n=1 Tax=Ideonella azotifigens TaxID=513160 RepID=A0ABN1KD19_9BURK|nr:choice-of-anchor tandem repeat GloVer-containing protein [Ideonella azotifigens]MCD2343717.1 hypothetical protein [Ideonella azotifigens]
MYASSSTARKAGARLRALGSAAFFAAALLASATPSWAAKGKTAYSFAGTPNGASPASDLLAHGGKFYGVTASGGSASLGAIYQLKQKDDGSWGAKTVFSFGGLDNGAMPQAGLIADAAGNLYGTAYIGGNVGAGTVLRLSPNADGSWTPSVLHHFTGGAEGYHPYGDLLLDAKGRLIGTAFEGGNFGDGVAFTLTPASDGSWTYQVIHHFHETTIDGAGPRGKLAMDANGVVYGITTAGGANFSGTLWSLTEGTNGWSFKVNDSFGSTVGTLPTGGVTLAKDGNLYGTGLMGGAFANGTVFKATPGKSGYKLAAVHDFTNDEGFFPYCSVLVNKKTGVLYAATSGGGSTGGGSVVTLTPQADGSYASSVLWGITGGSGAYSGLTTTKAGELLGTTKYGGKKANGQVYIIKP